MQQIAIYPGTFDPVTNGHLDLIRRAVNLFPNLVVAVASSSAKKTFFTLDERIHFLREAVRDFPQVRVAGFDCLLIHFAQAQNAQIIVRGLRAVSDFEYELQLAGLNRKMSHYIETVFLTPSENAMFISSSLVREISALGGDVSGLVPAAVLQALTLRNGLFVSQTLHDPKYMGK
jgi:pantetheine-phosphate adenylyltransferase